MASKAQKELAGRKLIENLNSDLRSLAVESKKKFAPVKEAAETGLTKIRLITAKSPDVVAGLLASSCDILQPFIIGCDTKQSKIVHVSLQGIQRLIQHQAVSLTAANNILASLWRLMETGVEEVKVLQTVILLITTNTVVQHELLAKALVLGFRLYFAKDSTTMNTAGAIVRQLVTIVFERVVTEDSVAAQVPLDPYSVESLKGGGRIAPKSLRPCAQDGYMLFQDLCQLVNADHPLWLVGITEMTRTFGLELLESVMTAYWPVFKQHPEFVFLLKERVCPLVIKLFSPSLKYRQGVPPPPSPVAVDRPFFPMVTRLLRIVHTLIAHFYSLLITECEIFLSLLVKFLDGEKPMWQRSLALEVIYKLSTQPSLVRCFVENYDMREHSTKVFRDTVNAVASFITSLFINPQSSSSHLTLSREGSKPSSDSQPGVLGGIAHGGGGMTPQPSFTYHGVWIPLLYNVPQASIKPFLIECLEKMEPPSIPEGYPATLAFACLLDIVKCVDNLVNGNLPPEAPHKNNISVALKEALVTSSWCGCLACFSLLLDASNDEQATQAILKSEETFVSLAGRLQLDVPRDAFITTLCKSSLPSHYALLVLNTGGGAQSSHPPTRSNTPIILPSSSSSGEGGRQEADGPGERSQVVAVGTGLQTANMPAGLQIGPVMLTAKNIQCMRSLLSVAHCHGDVLATAWHIVLTTLQHLSWILGLKPGPGGSLKAEKPPTDGSNTVVTTAIMSDLPVLSAMLSRLFESSQYLNDVALHHLIDALCKLSNESMELAYTNKEPSLFAVAKLLETGLVNIGRVEALWRPVTAHLLEICQHSHAGLRGWGAEAVTSLVRAALKHPHKPPLEVNQKLQSLLLGPLDLLTSVTQLDVRQRQMEAVLLLLEEHGQNIGPGWSLILAVIGGGAAANGDSVVRLAFQSLQLLFTDFLPLLPPSSLHQCVRVAGAFGLQQLDLNISLTAIGLLWNISDYFYQQRDRLSSASTPSVLSPSATPSVPSPISTPSVPSPSATPYSPSPPPVAAPCPAATLWLALYTCFGELCVDVRPAVRKSAAQTLFATIAAHGEHMDTESWRPLLWKVLFPLLDSVKEMHLRASDVRDRDGPEGNILMHHSRDTAQKQWAETQVLTLAGVSRVVSAKKDIIQRLSDFERAWAFLLEYIESAALSSNLEVSLAALKSLQELTLSRGTEEGSTKSNRQRSNSSGMGQRSPTGQNYDMNPPGQKTISRGEGNNSSGKALETTNRNIDTRSSEGHSTNKEEVKGQSSVEASARPSAGVWLKAWHVWVNIGLKATGGSIVDTASNQSASSVSSSAASSSSRQSAGGVSGDKSNNSPLVPPQTFLSYLLNICPQLLTRVRPYFTTEEFSRLSTLLHRTLAVPLIIDSSPFIVPSNFETTATNVQLAVLKVMDSLSVELPVTLGGCDLYPLLLRMYLTFASYAVSPPPMGKWRAGPTSVQRGGVQQKKYQVTHVQAPMREFSDLCIGEMKKTFDKMDKCSLAVHQSALLQIISSLRKLLRAKYLDGAGSSWRLALSALLSTLKTGLPILTTPSDGTDSAPHSGSGEVWPVLGATLEDFLFSKNSPSETQSFEDFKKDENLDCSVIEMIRTDILPFGGLYPKEFISHIIQILNRGSIYTVSENISQCAKVRENFAQACFETLLQFSFAPEPTDQSQHSSRSHGSGADESDARSEVSHLVVISLLKRCVDIVQRFVEDDKLSGSCPMSRHRVGEITSVLRALTTLLSSLKKLPLHSVEESIWERIIDLYPLLVDCLLTNSQDILSSLRVALLEYKDLITPPTTNRKSLSFNGGK